MMTEVTRLTCEEVFRRLDDYLDRELSPEEMRLVREHLDVCAVCTAEYRFEREVLDEVKHKLRRLTAPPGLLDKVKTAISKAQGGGT
jgi:anti-sigma factor (TIGR02949 family)